MLKQRLGLPLIRQVPGQEGKPEVDKSLWRITQK